MPIHDSLFADAKVRRRTRLKYEAKMDAEIVAKATAIMALSLKPAALHRLCYGWQRKKVLLVLLY